VSKRFCLFRVFVSSVLVVSTFPLFRTAGYFSPPVILSTHTVRNSGKDVGNRNRDREIGNRNRDREIGNHNRDREIGNHNSGHDVGNRNNGRDVGNRNNGRDVGNRNSSRLCGALVHIMMKISSASLVSVH